MVSDVNLHPYNKKSLHFDGANRWGSATDTTDCSQQGLTTILQCTGTDHVHNVIVLLHQRTVVHIQLYGVVTNHKSRCCGGCTTNRTAKEGLDAARRCRLNTSG